MQDCSSYPPPITHSFFVSQYEMFVLFHALPGGVMEPLLASPYFPGQHVTIGLCAVTRTWSEKDALHDFTSGKYGVQTDIG